MNRYCPRTPAPRLVVQPANYTGRIVREGAVLAKRLPVCPCALRADASARKPRSSLPLPTRASRARRLAAPARASADVLTGIARLGSQAHLGVRLKKDGYKVIGADWKKQEYFEEVTPPPPPSSSEPLACLPVCEILVVKNVWGKEWRCTVREREGREQLLYSRPGSRR